MADSVKTCAKHDTPDCDCECNTRKPLDVNKYATKKTIAQGMLDIALLTANASQLKYVLQVGEDHEFYILMLILITISIILQVAQAIVSIYLGSALDLKKEDDQTPANNINNAVLAINVVVVAINVLISSFDMRDTDTITTPTEPSPSVK